LEDEASQVKHVAIRDHNPESHDVLDVSAGDELSYERRKTIYPGWIWCTDSRGDQAWIPEAYVSIEGHMCRMIRDYISKELLTNVGDKVDVVEIESGWAWVVNGKGEKGWIPIECLRQVAA
jgi:hypothetical protein